MGKQRDLSLPKVGMNRATSAHLLNNSDYSLLVNGNSYDEGGEKFNITDEHSNILANKFKEGFKVVGLKNRVIKNITYYMLYNPNTNVSEIGYITNNRDFEYVKDTEVIDDCDSCSTHNLQPIPLEEQVQTEHQSYNTLVEDSCNICLEFDLEHPIVDIIIKEQNVGTKMFWTSTPGNKELRFIDLDNILFYKKTGDDNCGAVPQDICLDCEKLRVFKLFTEIKLNSYERILAGNLKKGSYDVLAAYCDELGNEFSDYTLLTPIIPIFDEANIIHEQEDNNKETSFSIKLILKNLDKRFDRYKVVYRYYTDYNNYLVYELGVYNTSDNTVILSNNTTKTITNNKLFLKRPFVETVDGLTTSNNSLILSGVKTRQRFNLQPVVSLMGSCIQWMSFRAKESLYKNANSYKYLSYNRDENVALSIDFGFNDGYRTDLFVFIPKPPTEYELDIIDSGDDYESITNIVKDCDGNTRERRWQYYNTATDLGACPVSSNVDTVLKVEVEETFTKVSLPSVPQGNLTISLDQEEEFETLESFIKENIQNSSLLGGIFPYVDLSNLTSFDNPPIITPESCNPFVFTGVEEVFVDDIINENITFIYPQNSSGYKSIPYPKNSEIYVIDSERNTSELDVDFSLAYSCFLFEINAITTVQSLVLLTRQRLFETSNDSCRQSTSLNRVTNGDLTSYNRYYFQNKGSESLNDLLDSNVNMPNPQSNIGGFNSTFYDKLHKTVMWFNTKIERRDKFYINISKKTRNKRERIDFDDYFNYDYGRNDSDFVRVSIFENCSSTSPIWTNIIDLNQNHFITIDVKNNMVENVSFNFNNLQSSTLYVSLEAPIKQSQGLGSNWYDLYPNTVTEDDNDILLKSPDEQGIRNSNNFITTYIGDLPDGAFDIVDRDEEAEEVSISWDRIDLYKTQKYETDCEYEIPVLKDCEPVPYKYGETGFYKSTDKYPDNSELYDSSNLVISKQLITNANLLDKLELYKESETSDTILLSDEANFSCKNIRHYKLPDNKLSPFINEQNLSANSEAIISPIGFTIDGEVVNNLLDVAVDNGLISSTDRQNIVDYKIYRADMSLDRSVVASGLVFNTKSYERDGKEINYLNYPYNSLGRDKYFPKNDDNIFDNFQAISPEFDYFKPSLPSEISLQGFMFGKSNSRILPVENHSKMVILGRKARRLSTTLAIIEASAELLLSLYSGSEVNRVQFGFTNSINPVGIGLGIAVAALGITQGILSKVSRYRLQWQDTFEKMGTPYNFGYYTASTSNYNYLKPLQNEGDQIRGISAGKYISSGHLNISDTTNGKVFRLNNIDREESAFFLLGDYPINNISPRYTFFDNTNSAYTCSQVLSSENGCSSKIKSEEINRNVASPYVAFKNYKPNQYGTINSIKWVDTNYCIDILDRGICNGILGGDTFISRHSKKRKARMFETDMLGLADFTPFAYETYENYGDAKYFIDYKVNDEITTSGKLFPNIFYQYKFDCPTSSNKFYIEPPSKFYLYSMGIVNFLCETRINTNFRNARKEPWNQFYPQNTDYEAITQPNVVNIRRPENFYYNNSYLQTSPLSEKSILEPTFSKENEYKRAYNPNNVMYSLPDTNENSITEPWLMYRPLDRATLHSKYGNLVNLKGIESDKILAYYEDALELINAENPFTDGQTTYNSELGNGGMFGKRAFTFRSTDIGYAGTQNKQTLSCEFGHFHADCERGQVFRYTNGTNLEEISRYSNGKPNGMDVWFKEHLPFKIKKDFPNFDQIKNPYNGIGIVWGWDSKYRRVLLTKKDYKVINKGKFIYYCNAFYLKDDFNNLLSQNQVTYEGDLDCQTVFKDSQGNQVNIDFTELNSFSIKEFIQNDEEVEDVSFTITFKPETGSWESYMSYKPNYYVNHTDYFQTGVNSDNDDFGLWSHLLSNKSYRVFYGKKYPFIIEYPIKNKLDLKKLETIKWKANLRRYHNDYDYATIQENPFDSLTVYNDYENSGKLNLIKNEGLRSQLLKYPITNPQNNTQDILVTYKDHKYNANYLFNRVKSNKNNYPMWIWDENQIDKVINNKAVSFYGKKVLERLRGEYFIVRLERNGNTNLDLDLRWSENIVNDD